MASFYFVFSSIHDYRALPQLTESIEETTTNLYIVALTSFNRASLFELNLNVDTTIFFFFFAS